MKATLLTSDAVLKLSGEVIARQKHFSTSFSLCIMFTFVARRAAKSDNVHSSLMQFSS